MEVLVAKDYIDGKITYEEAGTYNEKQEYCVVANTGAIPPGYQIDGFHWLGSTESTLVPGEYPAAHAFFASAQGMDAACGLLCRELLMMDHG